MKLSDRVQAMQNSPIRKFNPMAAEAKAQGTKIYHLNIGQPDIVTPSVFMESIKGFDQKVLAYAESPGLPELQDSIIDYFKTFDMSLDRKDILITSGGSEALTLVFLSLINPGDEVIVAEPYYTNYLTFIQAADGVIKPVTTYAEDGYKYAYMDRLEAAVTEKTKMISIVNPGNPTGCILSREDMRVICDFAKKHDLWILADEVYREFAYDGREMTSFGQYEDVADRVIIIDSISKRFSACGARIGCLISKNADLMANVMKIAMGRLCCPTLEMVGATALYKLDPAFFSEVRAEYEKRRNVSYEALKKIPGVVCEQPGGAFYITCKMPVENTEDLLVFLLKEFRENNETVMYAPAEGFYATPGLGKNELRIAYILNAEDMARGIELLGKGIEAYKAAGHK
ncbi:pyridoxal phosphate-dependent aminotransferase [Anaerotignum propionicum]|jgi:aspartate aminotransferase|uniref:Aminotransferase n=1 Tax=Anaerotignum propionicum DSM 1682 TaxID=991789 RepID=A0A110A6W2_ANAPI|nr:pyridoxal phosphate-dependent aminotransferase [Anaerotignum propionicum]AMJ40330.1 aspartate aminotransferase [Anaerotignum propionicum DSM 1682]MEA5057569.1 pyridoxal phosphate-dependent aminotransferase [Anaerotignum propionicum]SHE44872.1 aspartate aminotransferase [[Clostridium] propionicum DSM 1682] [Anaerotignum propionicum DSM 1682]